MLILGLDFETTGKDTSKDEIIEVGAVLWDTYRNLPIYLMSEYIWYESIWATATSTKDQIENITKISYSDLEKYGQHPKVVLQKLANIMNTPELEAIVAHNGNDFDKPILMKNAERWSIEIPSKPWIDTMVDIPYASNIQTRKLTHLAAEHGFVNPFAHRAIFDVLTMFRILQNYDVDWIYKLSLEPSITLVANTVPPWKDDGKSNEEAKSKGYRFHSETKTWIKNVKESQLQAETNNFSLGFAIKRSTTST